jgi:Zn finger protein HypA/HybF involved in hydrogenase expression
MEQKILDDSVFVESYEKYKTLSKIAVELNLPEITVWRRCKKLGLEFKNGGQNKGNYLKFSTEDILSGLHPQYSTLKLKKRLIKEKILEEKCSECGIMEWNGKEIILQLDHIDGNPKNHLLSNLRLLCPNCHSQTETFCGRNKRNK